MASELYWVMRQERRSKREVGGERRTKRAHGLYRNEKLREGKPMNWRNLGKGVW